MIVLCISNLFDKCTIAVFLCVDYVVHIVDTIILWSLYNCILCFYLIDNALLVFLLNLLIDSIHTLVLIGTIMKVKGTVLVIKYHRNAISLDR